MFSSAQRRGSSGMPSQRGLPEPAVRELIHDGKIDNMWVAGYEDEEGSPRRRGTRGGLGLGGGLHEVAQWPCAPRAKRVRERASQSRSSRACSARVCSAR
jgi:hypothetical protein